MCYTETEIPSFGWDFSHRLHRLSKYQLLMQPVINISPISRYFRFSVSYISPWVSSQPIVCLFLSGSMNVVAACKKNNIEYLISTSTTEINRGYTPRMNATERSVDAEIRALEDLVMPGYSSTKRLGEEVVLAANNVILSNGKRMRTLALRPPGIYGEYDHTYVTALLQSGKTFFGVLPIFGSMSSKMERVYVGNVAWAHIAAYRKVVADPSVGGTAYHICDGSSSANNFLWTKPVLETQSIKVLPFSIPFFIVYYFYFFLEFFVWLVSPLVDIRLPAERNHLYLCCTTVTYNGNLAKHRLDYKPLYTPKQAFQRSLNYYSNLKLWMKCIT